METILFTGKETISFKEAEDSIKVSVIVDGKLTQSKMVSRDRAKLNISILKELGYKEHKE